MDLQIFSKAVDILMHPRVAMHIQDLASLGKLKVLTFNNLACFYKKKKKFQLALKAVSYALDIEEYLAKNDERQ